MPEPLVANIAPSEFHVGVVTCAVYATICDVFLVFILARFRLGVQQFARSMKHLLHGPRDLAISMPIHDVFHRQGWVTLRLHGLELVTRQVRDPIDARGFSGSIDCCCAGNRYDRLQGECKFSANLGKVQIEQMTHRLLSWIWTRWLQMCFSCF